MPQSDPYPHYIEFRHIYKTFDKPVLVDVSFDVDPGETVAIIGRSGVGKSVTLSHIMGFLKPDSGRVIVAHEDITDFSEGELRRIRKKVTMVFQSGALFDSLTVGENVLFSLELREDYDAQNKEDVVDGLLRMVDIDEAKDAYPSDLSTGYKRAVAIARALAAQPQCVLYDEPTTMVDPIMSDRLSDLMLRLKKQLKLTIGGGDARSGPDVQSGRPRGFSLRWRRDLLRSHGRAGEIGASSHPRVSGDGPGGKGVVGAEHLLSPVVFRDRRQDRRRYLLL